MEKENRAADSDREFIKRFGPVAKPGLKSDWAARQRLLKRAWDAGVKWGWKHPDGLVMRRCGHIEHPGATRSTVARLANTVCPECVDDLTVNR